MTMQTNLLASFEPLEWSEETYANAPPFTIESVSGRVFLVARDHGSETTLDCLSSSLGLKKRTQGHVTYLVSRANAIRALREFDPILPIIMTAVERPSSVP